MAVSEVDGHPAASVVRFRMYNNYASFIKRAEIRIFEQQQSLQAAPLEIIAVDDAGLAEWQPAAKILAGPARELKYLLRAYDSKGNFDETDARPLWLYREPSPGNVVTSDGPPPRELLAAYGENDLARHQIPLGSGTVKVQGSSIPADHTVWVAGRQVPVDPQGNFAAEEILPDGTHTVEVAVLDDAGNGSLYLRDLEFKRRDLFYFGVADLTVSRNRASGPVRSAAGRERSAALRFAAGWPAGVLRERQGQRALAIDGERGYARRSGEGSVQQLPRQVARFVIPAHRSRLLITRRSATTVS